MSETGRNSRRFLCAPHFARRKFPENAFLGRERPPEGRNETRAGKPFGVRHFPRRNGEGRVRRRDPECGKGLRLLFSNSTLIIDYFKELNRTQIIFFLLFIVRLFLLSLSKLPAPPPTSQPFRRGPTKSVYTSRTHSNPLKIPSFISSQDGAVARDRRGPQTVRNYLAVRNAEFSNDNRTFGNSPRAGKGEKHLQRSAPDSSSIARDGNPKSFH